MSTRLVADCPRFVDIDPIWSLFIHPSIHSDKQSFSLFYYSKFALIHFDAF